MTAISDVLYQGPLINKASKAVLLLHGRGGTAQGIMSFANSLCDDHCYLVAPQATNNVWYPQSFMSPLELNEPYLSSSISEIKQLIDQTTQHISLDRLYIVGFSQGACMALEIASRFAGKYGGIIAFTGGLIGDMLDKSKYRGNFDHTKVFISNGDQDPFIPLIRSQESKDLMEKMGADVTLKVYKDRPHTVTRDELIWVKNNIFN